MAALPRVLQKIFGSSGNNGVVGSAQASAPTISSNIATLQSLPAFATGLTAVVESGKKLPPLEEIQALFNICTTQLAYILERGLIEYDSLTTYYIKDVVREAGTTKMYSSVTNSNIGNALSDGTNWTLLGDLANLPSAVIAQATESVLGILELASQAKTNTGTDDLTAVTPLKLTTWYGTKTFVSSGQTITAAGTLSIAHGLGGLPNIVTARLKCISAELGYSVNDQVIINPNISDAGALDNTGMAVVATATNLNVKFGSGSQVFQIVRNDTGAIDDITPAKWQLILVAKL